MTVALALAAWGAAALALGVLVGKALRAAGVAADDDDDPAPAADTSGPTRLDVLA